MRNGIDIDVILDSNYVDPKITIHTKERTEEIDAIIEAIEAASENEYPRIPVSQDDRVLLLPQREIIRVHTQGRKLEIETDKGSYMVGRTLSSLEGVLNEDRFIRISQSEIINLYKVKHFEFGVVGTVGIEFENGVKTWAARSRVKAIKKALRGQI